jgi:hypothetical protein
MRQAGKRNPAGGAGVPGARRLGRKAGLRVFKPRALDGRVRYRSWFSAQFVHSRKKRSGFLSIGAECCAY